MNELLINRIKKGDELAFEELVNEYKQKVYSTAFAITGNADDANDAAQEVFLKIYRYIGKFKGESSLNTWIFRICKNTCIDYIKANKKHINIVMLDSESEDEPKIEIVDTGETPESALLNNELKNTVLDAISSLPNDIRDVVILRDVQGLSYEEIAQICSQNLGTVKSRINRGRKRLKEMLKNEFFD